MSDYVSRMNEELSELNIKINKLDDFIGSSKFMEIEYTQKELLIAQFNTMKAYQSILDIRINLAK